MTIYNTFINIHQDKFFKSASSFISTSSFNRVLPYEGLSICAPSNTSKVLVAFIPSMFVSTSNVHFTNLNRNGTDVLIGDTAGSRVSCSSQHNIGQANRELIRPMFLVDTPGSSGWHTYNMSARTETAASTFSLGLHTSSATSLASTTTPNTFVSTSIQPTALDGILLDLNTEVTGSSIKQVSTITKTDTSESSSIAAGVEYNTDLTLTFTPTNASSKLLIFGQVNIGLGNAGDGGGKFPNVIIKRDSSSILIGDEASSRQRVSLTSVTDSNSYFTVVPINLMIDAGSTSETTISITLTHTNSADNVIYINRAGSDTDASTRGRGVSQLNVIEILPG